jgi:Zn-dependent protease
VVSLCLHEFAHAYVAYRSGDQSVEAAGYLTLNPLRYAHPFLSIVLPVLFIVQGGIGLPGGAVYLHPSEFRTRAQQSLAAAVGPLMNALFATVVLLVVRGHDLGSPHDRFWAGLAFLGFLQISAAVLNLLPIPGLDGYAIIEPYLSRQTQHSLANVKPWGMLGVFVLLQINQLNAWFFNSVEWLYDQTGAPRLLWAFGYELLQFWRYRELG